MLARPSRTRWGRLTLLHALAILFLRSTHSPVQAFAEEADAITWRTDYATALEEARVQNRLLWIQFTGPWCPNCTRMEQDSFSHPAIRQHAQQSFVPVKLRSDVHEQLALSFELSGLPATVIVAPSRQVVAVRQGYLGPDDLDRLLQSATREHTLLAQNSSGKPGAASGKPVDGSPEQTRPRTKRETQVALSGYCPVSLVSDKRLVPGQTEYTVTHEGRLYRFASLLTFNLFRRDPERYVPVNDGNCPVTQLDRRTAQPGDPRYGVLYQGRLFLCATDADRKKFLQEPLRYAAIDVAEQGFCPHCLAENGILVRGDPRYELNREGRHYWFPDATHREAFISAASSSEPPTRR